MSIHIGGRKIRDLHYGGQKIQEAYFGATKVYSSGPPIVHRLIGVWRQAWSGNQDEIRYQPGEIVTQNDIYYVALQPAANQEPSTSPEYWKPISEWSSGSQYRRRDLVLRYGVPWLATTPHTASSFTMPGVNRELWKLISRGGPGVEQPVRWGSGRRYEPASIVEYDSAYWLVNSLVASAFLPPGRSSKYVQLSKEFFA